MVAWSYDSYCTDVVNDAVEDWHKTQEGVDEMIDDSFQQILDDHPCESELEYLIGICIWGIRHNFKIKKDYLKISKELIKYLLEHGKFKDWHDKDKRRKKLTHEKNIILNVLQNKNLPPLKIIKKKNKIVNNWA